MEKMDRTEFITYLDTTPNSNTADYEILGIGITNYGISFNPQVESEKWIIEKNARNDHKSNQKQASVSQTIYKDDPCYQFVKDGIDVLNYKTHILDINMAEETETNTFKATLSDGLIAITKYMDEDAIIEYDLYYQGDSKKGTVTIGEDKKPVFTETV